MQSQLSIFNGKTVLVSGHTGFKGSWLTCWLIQLGAKVIGVSDCIPTVPSHFEAADLSSKIVDLRFDVVDSDKLISILKEYEPEFIFHLAAQPIVQTSFVDPLRTFQTNALGTASLLEALRIVNTSCVAIFITSDKVYENVEWVWGYRENDILGGHDPYSASKSMAEIAIASYTSSFFSNPSSNVKVAIGRAGNVIGGGDWSPFRLIPDFIKAWAKGSSVVIRNPASTRPWQHVLEPLSGYLHLATHVEKGLIQNGEAFNFGPPAHQNYAVIHLLEKIKERLPEASWAIDEPKGGVKEAALLKLNCDKALIELNWRPVLSVDETVGLTVDWYKSFYESTSNSYKLTIQQIAAFEAKTIA